VTALDVGAENPGWLWHQPGLPVRYSPKGANQKGRNRAPQERAAKFYKSQTLRLAQRKLPSVTVLHNANSRQLPRQPFYLWQSKISNFDPF
jgi:hypothetical protein